MPGQNRKLNAKQWAVLVVSVLALIGVIVGLVLGITFYSIYKSDAAETGRQFLVKNDKLKQDIGEVKEFSRFITGHVRSRADAGQAALTFTVIGERKTVTATVSMITKDNRAWRVTGAEYVNDQGRHITLFDPYEPIVPETEPTESLPAPTPTGSPARTPAGK